MWDLEKENKWKELTKEREASTSEVNRLYIVNALRDLADKVEKGEDPEMEYEMEYIRKPFVLAGGVEPSIVGYKINIIVYY